MRFSSATTAPSPIWPLPRLHDRGAANYRIEVHFREVPSNYQPFPDGDSIKHKKKIVDVVMAPKEREAVSAAFDYVFRLAREGYRRDMTGYTVIYWHRSLCRLKDRTEWNPDTIMCPWDA